MKFQLPLITLLLGFSCQSFAYFSFMDTGELKAKGEYRVLGETQVLFDDPNGMNLNGRFATGLSEESEMQFEAGVGSVDYYLAAFWKWVPFPDTYDQPAIGLRSGLTFADLSGYSTYGFNVTPFVSKLFDTNVGGFTPFLGLQIGLQRDTNDSFSTMQLVLGTEWKPNEWDFRELRDFSFLAEYGMDIDGAFDYLSLGASYSF